MGYPKRILARLMTYAELREWVRDYTEEPFDDRRCFDAPSARIEHLLANVNRDTKKYPAPWPMADFTPYPRPKPPAPEDLDKLILRNL